MKYANKLNIVGSLDSNFKKGRLAIIDNNRDQRDEAITNIKKLLTYVITQKALDYINACFEHLINYSYFSSLNDLVTDAQKAVVAAEGALIEAEVALTVPLDIKAKYDLIPGLDTVVSDAKVDVSRAQALSLIHI